MTGLGQNRDYQAAVASLVAIDHRGLAMRLLLEDVFDPLLEDKLRRSLVELSIQPNQVDLIIDYRLLIGIAQIMEQ